MVICLNISIALPALFAFAATVQSPYPSTHQGVPGVPPMLQRVDPTLGDISPLGDSLRSVDMSNDLRTPTGFQNVYRLPGRDDLLMRASGGVYAIFPQSVYVSAGSGRSAAIVPPGTVFSIGMPGPWSIPSHWVRGAERQFMMVEDISATTRLPTLNAHAWAGSRPIHSRRDDRREIPVDHTRWSGEGHTTNASEREDEPRHQTARATPPEPATFLRTIVTDDAYRSARLAELIKQALIASQGDRIDRR